MEKDKIIELEKTIQKEYSNTTGIIIAQNGQILHENYYNEYNKNIASHVFSITKSIFSSLIGIAIEEGYIKDINQKVLDFFPDYITRRGEKTAQKVTIKDMLTMTVPYKYKYSPYTKYFSSDDWVKTALDLMGGKGEIGEFRYAPLIGPDILSGVLTSATGKSALDFANEHLFMPMEINVDNNITFETKEEQIEIMKNNHERGWVCDPKGINTTGWGLFITTRDMLKLGQLYLNQGKWFDKQLVPEKWVIDSTSEHSRWGSIPYGYLWWLVDEGKRVYAAMGDGGNIIYINEKKNLVVVSSASFKPRAKDRLELIMKYIEPYIG